MRRIPQPQAWTGRNDHKPLEFSPRACGLGEPTQASGGLVEVQPTRMWAWGVRGERDTEAARSAHAHAGLGDYSPGREQTRTFSPRACGLGA